VALVDCLLLLTQEDRCLDAALLADGPLPAVLRRSGPGGGPGPNGGVGGGGGGGLGYVLLNPVAEQQRLWALKRAAVAGLQALMRTPFGMDEVLRVQVGTVALLAVRAACRYEASRQRTGDSLHYNAQGTHCTTTH
jgi:hypothetical protein